MNAVLLLKAIFFGFVVGTSAWCIIAALKTEIKNSERE